MAKLSSSLQMPTGQRDWKTPNQNSRHLFLLSVEEKLNQLGLRPGWGLKGNRIPLDGWAFECADDARKRGWGLTWHPGYNVAFDIGKNGRLSHELMLIGAIAKQFKELYGLQALVIHPDALQFGGPDREVDWKDLHKSRLSASQVLKGIKNHVSALQELNEICGGILLIENVHINLFNEKTPDELPTYFAAQLGYLDLVWMAQEAGVGTAFDAEHFWDTYNLIHRLAEYTNLPRPPFRYDWNWTEDQKELAKIAGYWLVKGYAPQHVFGIQDMTFEQYLELMQPQIFHFGSSRQLTINGKVNTHIETDTNHSQQRYYLLRQLEYLRNHGGIGAEVEVDTKPEWSQPRSADPNIAKMREYLTIIDAYEKLRKGIWKI